MRSRSLQLVLAEDCSLSGCAVVYRGVSAGGNKSMPHLLCAREAKGAGLSAGTSACRPCAYTEPSEAERQLQAPPL